MIFLYMAENVMAVRLLYSNWNGSNGLVLIETDIMILNYYLFSSIYSGPSEITFLYD